MIFPRICRALFESRKKPVTELPPPLKYVLEIDWALERDTKLTLTWHARGGSTNWYIDRRALCHAFRNGVGYDFINKELNVLKASGSCNEDEALQLRDFLRAWGHAHEMDY